MILLPALVSGLLPLQPLPPAAAQQTVPDRLVSLTTRQKAAQLIMPWVSGSYVAFDDPGFEQISRWVDSLGVGGIVVSVGTPTDLAAKVNELQRRARMPLLVAADFEAGTAFRIAGGTPFPTNMGVAAGGNEADAYAMGRAIAEEGRAMGVHLGFTPVADINSNPANPIINTRSFGGDPELVARMTAAQVRGMQDHGMLAVVKHFPGHGDTETDPHLGLPVSAADRARLDQVELVPFRAAIAAGAAGVMTAHIALPALDSGRRRPATMVPELLSGLLREALGFGGLLVTDALDMGAVVREYGPGEAAVQAFLAGNDILLMPTDPWLAVVALVAAVDAGRISLERLDRSVERILALKDHLRLFDRPAADLAALGYVVGRRETMAVASQVSAGALVLLRDEAGLMDRLGASGPVGLVTYGESNAGTVGSTLASELRSRGYQVRLQRLGPASGPASFDSASAVLGSKSPSILAISVRAVEGRGSMAVSGPVEALLRDAATSGQTLVVSLGSPYLISQVPEIPAYLLAWTSNPLVERAVADALAGAPITGTLPVAIPPLWQIGDGIRRPGASRGSPP